MYDLRRLKDVLSLGALMFIVNKIFLRFLLILPLCCAILLSVILQKPVIFYDRKCSEI